MALVSDVDEAVRRAARSIAWRDLSRRRTLDRSCLLRGMLAFTTALALAMMRGHGGSSTEDFSLRSHKDEGSTSAGKAPSCGGAELLVVGVLLMAIMLSSLLRLSRPRRSRRALRHHQLKTFKVRTLHR